MQYIDARSTKNLNRVSKADPWTVLEDDKFFQIITELNKDKRLLKEFLLKESSIEYDFTRHYDTGVESNEGVNGSAINGKSPAEAGADVQLQI